MAIGFSDHFDFRPIVGWELYQVTIDKYHVMFWFENESALLNVADKFSFKSLDGALEFTYQIYGNQKSLNLDRILRVKIAAAKIVKIDQLDLIFENGDILSIHDNPELRSWWFLGGRQLEPLIQRANQRANWSFEIGDCEPDELTEEEWQRRRT